MNKIIAHIIVSLADFAVLNPGDHLKSFKSGLKWLKWINFVRFWVNESRKNLSMSSSLKSWEHNTIEIGKSHIGSVMLNHLNWNSFKMDEYCNNAWSVLIKHINPLGRYITCIIQGKTECTHSECTLSAHNLECKLPKVRVH